MICKYSIVRLHPSVETGEFVNVGMVFYFIEANEFYFKLLKKDELSRALSFFNWINKKTLIDALEIIENECTRIKDLNPIKESQFIDLIKPQEGIIQYSNCRVHSFKCSIDEIVRKLFQGLIKT